MLRVGVGAVLVRNGPGAGQERLFEWDDFRDELIATIKDWEDAHPADRSSWNYYDQFLAALERAVVKAGIIDPEEIRAALAA